jgi:hypothetical protein
MTAGYVSKHKIYKNIKYKPVWIKLKYQNELERAKK